MDDLYTDHYKKYIKPHHDHLSANPELRPVYDAIRQAIGGNVNESARLTHEIDSLIDRKIEQALNKH